MQRLLKILTDHNRLLDLASIYAGFICASCAFTNALVCAHGWSYGNLARHSHQNRRHLVRRRLELLDDANIATCSTVGEYRAIPQVDAMAVLLDHGSDDKAAECSLRWG